MRETGLEPARPCGHQALNLARLPIPPFPQKQSLSSLYPPVAASREESAPPEGGTTNARLHQQHGPVPPDCGDRVLIEMPANHRGHFRRRAVVHFLQQLAHADLAQRLAVLAGAIPVRRPRTGPTSRRAAFRSPFAHRAIPAPRPAAAVIWVSDSQPPARMTSAPGWPAEAAQTRPVAVSISP